jgi:hypothetical protein
MLYGSRSAIRRGVLDFFYVAEGTQTVPAAGAFNGISCG